VIVIDVINPCVCSHSILNCGLLAMKTITVSDELGG